ncbi:MAG: VWA domain-containing protein [Mycobacteriales bacterium]
MRFAEPSWFLLFIAVAALLGGYLVVQWRRRRYAARFSNVNLLRTVVPKRPGWRRHLTFAVLLLGLSSLTLAMAKPNREVKVPRDKATIMMVIDTSWSMKSTDVSSNGQETRLSAAQRAATEFVGLLPNPINLGLVAFNGQTSVTDPTTDRNIIKAKIIGLQLGPSTATGDAILAAISSAQSFQKTLSSGSSDKSAPIRIVLLSDGARTVGRSVADGIKAAQVAKISVSTIAFGTPTGTVDLDGQQTQVPVDIDTMKQIAVQTGGSFHAAASAGELRAIYTNIGSSIGYTKARKDVSHIPLGIGAGLAFLAAGLSLLWTGRLL